MRINKYLAQKKLATRREADELIKKGQVFLNGKPALLGSQVNDGDKVEIKGQTKKYIYLAYYKPKGIITHSPQGDEIEIINDKNLPSGIFPIGRLDKNSHGLIILTNDGRITDRLLNPKFVHEKEYRVRTHNKLNTSFQNRMKQGVDIEGYITKKCKVRILDSNSFKIILTEGKKHQIRRMCSALHQEVKDLKRERIMNIKLDKLKPGEFRKIEGPELKTFLKELSLN